MKKILVIAALMLGFAVAASAQQRAIGLRGGYGVELSYQHTVGAGFVEADLGLGTFNSLNVAASYNMTLAEFGEGFHAYWGPSASVGMGIDPGWFGIGVGGNIGIEYIFPFPLQISVDIRPQVGLQFGMEKLAHYWGYPTLGIRYAF